MKPSSLSYGTWSVSDREVVALAVAAWLGAMAAIDAPVLVPMAAVTLAAFVRRPGAWWLAVLLVVDVLAVRSLEGLQPVPEGDFAGVITLVTDPEPDVGGRLRFEAATSAGRLLAEAASPAAVDALGSALAGERVAVTGSIGGLRPSGWTRSRHLAGSLDVAVVRSITPGSIDSRAANSARRHLERGTSPLTPRHRSLLSGLVLGDDRAQPPELTADFRAAGLTHLLAVSGQNVLFVLAVFGPVLRRIRIWPRLILALGIVAAFALVTRFEPSVLRAAFVAGVSLFATTTGRPGGGLRHLSIAVCLLLVVDPLLVHSLGFRLSVAASLGVLVLAPRIVPRIPGPRWLRDGLGVTAGAQIAVAPVLVPVLGPMPLAALPANVVAGPVAGFLMVWGLTAGTLAGFASGSVARVLHAPSALGLAALEQVAAVGAALPLGTIGLRHLVLGGFACALALVVPRARLVAVLLATVALVSPVFTPVARGTQDAGRDAAVWVDGPVAVVDLGRRADPVEVVEALRRANVVTVGLLVTRSTRPEVAAAVAAIDSRFPVGAVVGPPGTPIDRVVVPTPGFRATVGALEVVVDVVGPPMRARIGWRSRGVEEDASPRSAIGSTGARAARPSSIRRSRPAVDRRVGRGARRCRADGRQRCRGHPPGVVVR